MRLVGKRRFPMRNERADAHHMGLKILQEHHVLRQATGRLPGRANHEPGAYLVADLAQGVQAALAFFQQHSRRMQGCVVGGIRRFMTKKVASSPRIEQALVRLARALAQGKGYGTVGVALVDGGNYAHHALVVEERVFPTLQNEGTKAQAVALLAACQYLFFAKAIAVRA